MNSSRKSMEETISLRLFFIGLLSLFLTAGLCIFVFHKAFREQVWADLETECGEIAAAYPYLDNDRQLADLAGDELRITLISSDGTVLYESATAKEMENHLSRPEIRQALESGSGRSDRDSSTMGLRTYYYAIRLSNGSILRLAQDAQDIWSIYDEALPAVLLCCLVIMGLSILLSWLLTRQLIKPIMAMTQHLDEIRGHVPYRELMPFADAIHADRLLRRNNEALRQEFTANVSHELKTPLTSISGYAELIENGMVQPADIPSFGAKIHAEASRMIALVNDILELSHLDSMQGETQRAPVFETVDLAEIARGCVEHQKLNAKKAYITLSVQGEAAPVQGDRLMLEELCQNLCDNAIRYNRPGGKVELATGKNRGGCFLKVSDNGIGIPQEAQSRVFERFYRVDKSHSKATGGTGLGLAIVKHIARIHNAQIQLESQVGTGTQITVQFDA
jgi:two-component system phosphate regulon sensor histidine kinase PhoR